MSVGDVLVGIIIWRLFSSLTNENIREIVREEVSESISEEYLDKEGEE